MNASRSIARVCMRFAVSTEGEPSRIRNNIPAEPIATIDQLTKRRINTLLFDNCDGCSRMAAIPQGAFAARKLSDYNERRFLISKMEKKGDNDRDTRQDTGYSKKNPKDEGRELTPLKYNSKLMNSIWGLYNRYSVHNFKKNTDADDIMKAAAIWGPAIFNRPPKTSPAKNMAAAQIRQLLATGNAKI